MRLHSLDMTNVAPIDYFAVDNLADIIVIAGPNGVGKTRLVQGIVSALRNPGQNPSSRLVIQATSQREERKWGRTQLDTLIPEEAQLLASTVQQNQRRTHWESSVFQFESDRANPQYNAYSFSWDASDPWEEVIGWDFGFNSMRNRYNDTISSLFRKVHSQRDAIAKRGLALIRNGGGHISPDEFPDPLLKFKDAFSQLLSPKELLDPDPKNQTIIYRYKNTDFPLSSLSSGEREVINIVFDFLLKDATDSIIIFDEPELHLHPELSYKLLHTLRNSGERNQFIFVTHSPDIITASLEHSVIFVRPSNGDGSNQAIIVKEDDETNEALNLIGQSIGIVSLGKKIVLIEGSQTSLDKQTYGAILKDRFSNLVLVPSGGKGLIQSFGKIAENVLKKSLWGIDFFMLCDHDALPFEGDIREFEELSNRKLKLLSRYHLENYFLEESVLVKVFQDFETDDSWLRDENLILQELKGLARQTIPYAVALKISAEYREAFGNLDLMIQGCHNKNLEELIELFTHKVNIETDRFTNSTNPDRLRESIHQTYYRLEASIDDGGWKFLIPGKSVLDRFAHKAKFQSSRMKLRYIKESQTHISNPFQEIIDIFSYFSEH